MFDRLVATALATLACALIVLPAHAQRTDENAVRAAEDAFGVTIGRETLGLYTSSSVRGFSPTAAGNARIDGLYFDQVWAPNARLRRTTTIRVGPSAQSYPFPAPTGIIDHALKIPGASPALSLLVSADEWGSTGIEADVNVPLVKERLSLGLGAAMLEEEFHNGTDAASRNGGARLRWTPSDTIEVMSFFARSEARDDEFGPIYVPGGPYLPPRVQRRQFDGPSWVDYDSTAINYGAVASFTPTSDWRVRLGAFRSLFDDHATFAHLLLELQPDGSAERVIVADPPGKTASTSGELRITRALSESTRLHELHLTLRARDRMRRYDGADTLALGPTRLGMPIAVPKPVFEFGPQTQDEVTQHTAGLAYELRWAQRGQIGLGLQRSWYHKRVNKVDVETRTHDEPWLYNFTAAYALSEALTGYASYTRGLEESGLAPQSASNRGEALPAIRTRQADAGVRCAISPSLKLLAGVFDVTKPYFTLDESNRFGALGDVTHRGVEISLSGAVGRQLDIVAGAVFMDPEVSGPDVRSGLVGSKPVGISRETLLLNADWRLPVSGTSVDIGVRHVGGAPATRDNRVTLPSRTLIDLGARYRFAVGRVPATLRLSITNLTDEYGYELRGSGVYDVIPGRNATVYVTVDWAPGRS
jgi:iron complex outermembrane receptor protein